MMDSIMHRILILGTLFSIVFVLSCEDSAEKDSDAGTDAADDALEDGGDGDAGEGNAAWAIEGVNAPDQFTVMVRFEDKKMPDNAGHADAYAITSEKGDLEIDSVTLDPETGTAAVATAKQKLGVTYTLKAMEDGVEIPDQSSEFLAADTARFWVTDFSDLSGYTDYEIVAQRRAVGEHAVAYVETGFDPAGVFEAVAHFDEKAFPIETSLFNEVSDIDGNGRVLLLGVDGGMYYGGFFNPMNHYTNEETLAMYGIHSNEMEMVHINVAVSDFDGTHTIIPHEFQHMLYFLKHGLQWVYWAYHDEGLAECAVRAVNGSHDVGLDYYLTDPGGMIGAGLSLVDWIYATYEQYVLAYLFWTYAASQIDGMESYGDIFDLPTGQPDEVDAFLRDKLGLSFPEVQRNGLLAAWVQGASGAYSFGGMIEFPQDSHPPTTAAGTSSVDLEPFSATFFVLSAAEVDYPGTQGPDIVYAGIDGNGNVDLEEPFSVSGGALLVHNARFDMNDFTPQRSGPDQAALLERVAAQPVSLPIPAAWTDPPPINPLNPAPLRAWKRNRLIQLGLAE